MPLKERLLRYFQKHHTTWIPSGEIQRLVVQYTGQTPRTCVRRLQELAESGLLERRLNKNHAHYRLKTAPTANETPQPALSPSEIEKSRLEALAYFDSLPDYQLAK